MFFGTTPQIVSQFLASELTGMDTPNIFVPFAGNFVVEQIAGSVLPSSRVHSTDVSLYSRAIGFGVTNNPEFDALLTDEVAEMFPYMASHQNTPMEKAAVMIFMTEASQNIRKMEKTAYYASMHNAAVLGQESYFEKIMKKLQSFQDRVKNLRFTGKCATTLIPEAKAGDLMFYDPPVLLGDYEAMFKALEGCYNFTPEPYEIIDDKVKLEQLEMLNEKGVTTYYRTNEPLEKMPEGYSQVFEHKYKWNAAYCIYTNKPNNRFVGRFQPIPETVMNLPILGPTDVITKDSEVLCLKVSSRVANHYRLMWVRKAEMSNAGSSWLVLVDGKLIGMFCLSDGVQYSSPYAVIFSDPAAPGTNYKRLSRLILHVILSEEVLNEFNDMTMWEHTGFTTRVFTNAPVSMKYRGLFKLEKRDEAEGAAKGNFKYCLIYHSKKLVPTVSDALKAWVKKHGNDLWIPWPEKREKSQ